MQKRVRKNSEYICPKKPKLEIAINNDSEKSETAAAMPSQYEQPPKVEVDIQSESVVRGATSVSCSDVNITEKSPVLVNSIMKTFAKSEIRETDVVELKEVPQKMLKTDENEHVQQQQQCPVEITSDNPNKTISAASILPLQESTASLQDSVSLTKHEVESVQALSNYKLLQNDSAGEFETSAAAAEENTNNKPPTDGSSPILISAKSEQLTNNTKESLPTSVHKAVEPLPMNSKAGDDVVKGNLPNMLGSNLSLPNPAQLEPNSTGEKKKPGDQTTAKVSIGNTTISVPLLPFRRIITKEGKSNIVRKVINIHGKKMKAPTIVQLSQVNLTPKTSAKIVQATLVGNKIQLPNMGFKSSGGYLKSNFVNPSTMNVTSLPKQIFEDEMVYVEKPQQPQAPPSEDSELKTTESPPVSNAMNKAPGNQKEDVIPKSSPSYLTQVCVIESDSTAPSKPFESNVTDSLPSSITVASTSESTLTRVTPSMSKAIRKPLMVTKALTPSEVSTTGEILRSANVNNDSSASKDNPQLASKLLEDNILLRKQFAIAVQNCNKFQLKVTKRNDDMKPRTSEVSIGQPRRQMSQMAKTGPIGGQSSGADTVLVTNVEKIEKIKSDDTQNVLLKHLLQSSISQRSNASCNQSMAPRKLATVRAPSLGVVSSLEAQLARPVIPPVSSVGDHKSESKMPPKNGNDKLKKAPMDRESAPMKTRPEMISRETSFVSTFSPKPKTHPAAPPPDYERVTNMPPTTIQQQVETEAPKAVQYQQTATNTNYNSINVFKFFKEKEQVKTAVSRPVESNANSMQNNLLSPDHNSDTKMFIKTEYDSTTHSEAASSPTIKAKLNKMDSNEENVEMRKRFKRDYQKHKRQMVLNKDAPNHQKKKSRKLSKACEDFDEFIENKVVQMKQMFVLEVLEPLLSTFLGICSVYGYNDKMRNQVEHAYHNVFKEDFGKTNLKNLVDFYGVKPYGPGQSSKVSNVPSFQNKFYDEEFSTMNHDSCDKLFQFISTLKQQSLQSSENISLVSSPQPTNELRLQAPLDVSYPGIRFEQSFELDDDRMSPVIPFISANHFGEIRRRKPNHANRKKCSFGSTEKTIRLKLSSFVAENLLDILRDLENLLNVYSPVSYKLLNNDKLNVRNIKGLYLSRIKNLQRTESTNIQNFLNGTYKCCRKCHLIIICGIVGADSNSNIKKRILSDSHFCDKYCCIQYQKKSGRKYVVSRKRERSFPNNKQPQPPVNRISAIENNNCYNSSNYKVFSPNCFWKPAYKANAAAGEDVNEICMKMRVAITLNTNKDTRRCILCNQKGDSFAEGSSRLLNYDVNKWVHLNCALWSNSVYETINGGLMNLELTMQQGLHQVCTYCNQYGASIKCFKMRCSHTYHLPCAIKEQCVFYKNKTIHCASHAHRMEKKNELSSIRVRRRVYIERDENRQVAAVMHHLELSNLLRIGNLTFINVGQLLPHQLEAFHTPNFIYPIGYKIIRFFWSMKKLNKRCRYICSIAETNGRPEFIIQVQEPCEPDVELRDISPRAVWKRVLEKIVLLRKGQPLVQFFAEFMNGEDLFGLSEPSIVRILESLPGVESLTDYRFKYGRNPLLELPLAVNPSGSARTEPKQRHIINWKKAHTQRTSSINLKLSLSPSSLVAGEVACPYSKQFVHSKSSQYRKMKQEWRNNVYLARSKIQGLGLYAARDLEKHTMVIEYIGQVIRTEVSELREKQYDLRNRGIYMFRLDEERVVDATLSGGLARYINHSCNPNCVTEIVDVDREYRIIIFAKRRINKGEELSYDYKFDIEDDANKISCMCDAPNCRKWMN